MLTERKCPDAPAKEFDVGTRRKGNDGEWWVASKTESGMMRWKPFVPKSVQKEKAGSTKTSTKTSPKTNTSTKLANSARTIPAKTIAKLEKEKAEQNGDTGHNVVKFSKDFAQAAKELRSRGIYTRVKPAGKDLDSSTKSVLTEMSQHISWDPELTPYIFYTENAITRARDYGTLYLTFRLPSKKSKQIAREVLSKHFKGKCEWDGKDSTKIIINVS